MSNFTEYFEIYLQNHSLPSCLDLMPDDDSGITFKQRFIDRNRYKEIGSETEELFDLHMKIKAQECVNRYKWKIEFYIKNRDDLFARLINFEDTYSSKKSGTKDNTSEQSNTETTTDVETLGGKDVVNKDYTETGSRSDIDEKTVKLNGTTTVENEANSESENTKSTITDNKSNTTQHSDTESTETDKVEGSTDKVYNTEDDTFYNPIVLSAEGKEENIVDAGKRNGSENDTEKRTDNKSTDTEMDYTSETTRHGEENETDTAKSKRNENGNSVENKTETTSDNLNENTGKTSNDTATTNYGKTDNMTEDVNGNTKGTANETYEDNFESKSNVHKLYSFFKSNPELMKDIQELENIYEEALAYMDVLFMGVL